jgi:hypothetical protein
VLIERYDGVDSATGTQSRVVIIDPFGDLIGREFTQAIIAAANLGERE